MHTAPLNFNVVVTNAFLCLRFRCSSTKQMREFDDLCRYMLTERHLSKYVLSTRANSCDSLSGFTEAHEVTEVFVRLIVAKERYIEPEGTLLPTMTVAATRRLATTMLAHRLKFQSWPRSLLMLNHWRRRAHRPYRRMLGGRTLWLNVRN
eukprot:2144922-Pleurochrysis_carterae.AAC.1